MKAIVFVNGYERFISNESLTELLNDVISNPRCNPEYDREGDVEVSLWSFQPTFSGYGHYKLQVKLEINGQDLTIYHTTTDMQSIDDWKSDEFEEERRSNGLQVLLESCISNNEEKIIDLVLKEEEEFEF